MTENLQSNRVQALAGATRNHAERETFRIPFRIGATSRGRGPRGRVCALQQAGQVIHAIPQRCANGGFLPLNRVATGNRIRRAAGEGMAQGESDLNRPCLIGRASSSYCESAGCNSAPREQGRLGVTTIGRDCSNAKRPTDGQGTPSKPPLTLRVRGGLCSLSPSEQCPSSTQYNTKESYERTKQEPPSNH